MSEVTPIPKKKRKKVDRTKACDKLFGQIVRAPGRCVICSSTEAIQCAHGFSRRYRATRWDTYNGFALCRGCHLKYTLRPLEWDEWLHDQWGDSLYAWLRDLALHGRNPDLDETYARLSGIWKQMQGAA